MIGWILNLALRWYHMSVMASKMTGGIRNNNEITKDPHYWPFTRGNHTFSYAESLSTPWRHYGIMPRSIQKLWGATEK